MSLWVGSVLCNIYCCKVLFLAFNLIYHSSLWGHPPNLFKLVPNSIGLRQGTGVLQLQAPKKSRSNTLLSCV